MSAGWDNIPPPAALCALAIERLDGQVRSAVISIDKAGRRPTSVRVVAWMPDLEAAVLLAALVEALGATLEVPEGSVVSFRLPASAGAFPALGI